MLTEDSQRGTILKLVLSPNLLKQENVSHSVHLWFAAGARAEPQSICDKNIILINLRITINKSFASS